MALSGLYELYGSGVDRTVDLEGGEIASRVSGQLRPAEALTVYYVGEKVAFAIVVEFQETRIVRLNLTPNEARSLTQHALAYFELGSASARRNIEHDRVTVGLKNALQMLYGKLLSPLHLPSTASRLIVVPDKSMHGVPWAALSIPSQRTIDSAAESMGFARLQPLADRYEISVLPSALILLRDKEEKITSGALIASSWGYEAGTDSPQMNESDKDALHGAQLPPLTGTIEETITAANLLHLPPTALSIMTFRPEDRQAAPKITLEKISDALGKRTLIHIAAHGMYNPKLPMSSFLLLDPSEGLLLRASDFLKFDLSTAQIVLLTACQTGNIVVHAGNEIMGFARGLFAAGAKRLLLTNWLVDDRVSLKYTTAFYDALSGGSNIEAAHALDIKKLRQQYAHPYYWAGYVMMSRD
jgi:CHAT domain-containing protein